MAKGFNHVILMGNVARDPDIKTIPSGAMVARFTLAVGREWKDKNGEKQSECDFISCQAWDKLAEVIQKFVKKGKGLHIVGSLRVSKYQDKTTGQDRWSTDVVVRELIMLPGRSDENGTGGYQQTARPAYQSYTPAPAPAPANVAPLNFDDEFPLDLSDLGGGDDDIECPF